VIATSIRSCCQCWMPCHHAGGSTCQAPPGLWLWGCQCCLYSAVVCKHRCLYMCIWHCNMPCTVHSVTLAALMLWTFACASAFATAASRMWVCSWWISYGGLHACIYGVMHDVLFWQALLGVSFGQLGSPWQQWQWLSSRCEQWTVASCQYKCLQRCRNYCCTYGEIPE